MRVRGIGLLTIVAAAFAVTACGRQNSNVNEQEFEIDMEPVVQDLRALSNARILLGHQSVGRNILTGLASLADEADVPLRIVEVTGAPSDAAPGVFHSNIGKNGDPDSKCEMFGQLLTGFGRPEYDIAMMKFCYVDLGRDTPLEVEAMIDRYARLVDTIRTERPDVQLVHVTMPLRSDPPGKKTMLKRFLGMSLPGDDDNVLRNAFNDALRTRYANEPLFDLAVLESTLPDGSRTSFEHEGESVYTLADRYTNDGGHLNEQAQRLAAIAFVRALVETLETSAPEQKVAER